MNVGAGGRRGSLMRKLNIPRIGIDFKQFKKLGKLSKPGRVLVFEETGTGLHGAVASCTTSSAFALGATALSSAPDRAVAVGEVLAQLKSQSRKRLPRTAVLLTPCAAGALLSLPVNPKKPRPAAQMAEMVRWELEELVVQQNELWTLGALLMGRGHLSHEQRRELESRAQAEGRRLNAALYGEVVAREHLEECLLLQEQLTAGDEELATGWFGQAAGEEEEDSFSWLVAGVGSGLCDGWARAFKKHGVFLARIYPRTGACLPLIPPEADWLLVDAGPEQWSLFLGRGRRIEAMRLKPCAHGRAVAAEVVEAVGDLLPALCNRLYLSAPGDQWPELAAALDRAYGRRGLRVTPPLGDSPQPLDGDRLAALSGVARHHLGLGGKGMPMAPIVAQPPAPPLWKRRDLWPWMGIGLIVLSLGVLDTYFRIQGTRYQDELDRLDVEYATKMQLKKQAEEMAAEARKAQAALAAKEQELREAERQRDILDNVIRHRQELIPGLLQVLGESIGELVLLDSLEESADRKGFYLAGWALTDTDGQQFANTLNEQLQPWKFRVRDVKLIRAKGRLGLDGYQLSIWLTQASAPADNKPGVTSPPPAEKGTAKPAQSKSVQAARKSNARGSR